MVIESRHPDLDGRLCPQRERCELLQAPGTIDGSANDGTGHRQMRGLRKATGLLRNVEGA